MKVEQLPELLWPELWDQIGQHVSEEVWRIIRDSSYQLRFCLEIEMERQPK